MGVQLKPRAKHWWQASIWLAPFGLLAIPMIIVHPPGWMWGLLLVLGAVGLMNFGYAAAVDAWRDDREAWLEMMRRAPEEIEERARRVMRQEAAAWTRRHGRGG